jgi:transcriptional regulator with XRE-family HTH domain
MFNLQLQKRRMTTKRQQTFASRLTAYLTENGGASNLARRFVERVPYKGTSTDRAKAKYNDFEKFKSLISRWSQEDGPEPSFKHLRRLCEVTGVSADYWLFGDKPLFPTLPEWWTAESRTFAREFIRASAVSHLDEPQRQSDLEALYVLADRAAHKDKKARTSEDFGSHDAAIVANVAALPWLEKIHREVGEHVDREIQRRTTRYLTRT